MKKLYHGHNLHECQYIYDRCVEHDPIVEYNFSDIDNFRITEEKDINYINVIYQNIGDTLYGGFIYCSINGWIATAVEPELRNRGIASKLIDGIQREMHLIDMKELQWACRQTNTVSYKLALSKGFVLYDQGNSWYHLKYFGRK